MEAVSSSKTPIDIQQTTRRFITVFVLTAVRTSDSTKKKLILQMEPYFTELNYNVHFDRSKTFTGELHWAHMT